MPKGKNKPVIVLGAGGHAVVLVETLRQLGIEILGMTDSKWEKGTVVAGIEIIGSNEIVFNYSPEDICLINGIGWVVYSSDRWEIGQKMRDAGFRFQNVVDPMARVSPEVKLDEGIQIMAGAVIQPHSRIGKDSILNTGVVIDHHCIIGDECHICPGVTLAGRVKVGNRTMIGTGSTVLPGKEIGCNTIVAAASVVHKNIPSNTIFIQRRKESVEKRG